MNIIVQIKNLWREQKNSLPCPLHLANIIYTSFQIYIYDFLKSLKYQFILFHLSQVQIQGKGLMVDLGCVIQF